MQWRRVAAIVCSAFVCGSLAAQQPAARRGTPAATASFDTLAAPALLAMRKKAEELKTGGVALVAYFEGDKIESWSSKMVVVGKMTHEPTADKKGDNLLAVAYTKAAEMADTLKNSGSKVRPPMTGETGWEGGVIAHVQSGYVIAAFSGGASPDDVAVSRAGLAEIVDHAASLKAVP